MQENKENITKTIHRLSEYTTKTGISFNKLATEIGISNSYFSKMIKNGGSIGSDIIENILRIHPDINADWLMTGRGSMLHTNQDQFTFSQTNQPILDETFVYKMYKEKEVENKELTAKIIEMAEEIGSLKSQLNNQNKSTERLSMDERISDAFTPGSFVVSGEESTHTKKRTSSTKPIHGKA